MQIMKYYKTFYIN